MTKDSLNMFLKNTYNIRFGKSASRKNSLGDSSQNVRVTDVRALSRKNRCSENFLEQRRLLLQNISQNIDFLKSPLKSLSNSQNDFSNRVFTNTHYNERYSGNQRNKSSISSRDVSRRIESNDIHSIVDHFRIWGYRLFDIGYPLNMFKNGQKDQISRDFLKKSEISHF